MNELRPEWMPDEVQMRQLQELYVHSARLKKANIPGFGADYVVFLPASWLKDDPKGARAYGMQVCYSNDIDAPMIGFDPASKGWVA